MKTISDYSIKSYPANLQITINYDDGDYSIIDYSTDYSCCMGEYTKEEWKEGLREEHPEWNEDIYNDIIGHLSIIFNDEFFVNE